MGAGRTELLECLFGSTPQTPQGKILLEGRPVLSHPAEAMRAGIALVTEDRKRLGIFANLDVGEKHQRSARWAKTRFGWLICRRGTGHGPALGPRVGREDAPIWRRPSPASAAATSKRRSWAAGC